MIDEKAIRSRCEAVRDSLDEAGRRLFAAAEACAGGYRQGHPVSPAQRSYFAEQDGVYDIASNTGWVSVGVDPAFAAEAAASAEQAHDTAEFAVNAVRNWYASMGRERYPEASQLMITADGGGSNGSRVRLWKLKLQELADETGLSIPVCHDPPGTLKWNKQSIACLVI